jgi:hypothetical protein
MGWGGEQLQKAQAESQFIIKIEYPKLTQLRPWLLSLESDGTLRDTLGHEVDSKELSFMMGNAIPKKELEVHLVIQEEDKISAQTLGKLLARLRALSNPNRKTVLYLHLKEYLERKK